MPWLSAAAHDEDSRCASYVTSIVEGPGSFLHKRERVDEYGWRYVGDLYADYEAAQRRGPKPMSSTRPRPSILTAIRCSSGARVNASLAIDHSLVAVELSGGP